MAQDIELYHQPREPNVSGSRTRSRSRSRSAPHKVAFHYTNPNRSRASIANSFINCISNNKGTRGSDTKHRHRKKIYSLYELLLLELNIPTAEKRKNFSGSKDNSDLDNTLDEILNMLRIPAELERFILFGLLVSLNSFLTIFTLIPLKLSLVTFKYIKELIHDYRTSSCFKSETFNEHFFWARRDIITVVIGILALIVLSIGGLDISRMYHDVKGQADIKLYVTFGVLEVADRLCSAIGQEALSLLYKVPINTDFRRVWKQFFILLVVSSIYVAIHAFVLIYETVSLNVAANSYSNALLTLLLSNQFGELKGSVFKKFEREGLFQLTMADLTERFQLSLMLAIIALRNFLQLGNTQIGIVPTTWKNWNTWLGAIYGPIIVVIGSEVLVDWLKHCYIVKFNKIKSRIYKNYLYVICLDYLKVFRAQSSAQISYSYELTDYLLVTRRIGIPLLPSLVCFIRMIGGDIHKFLNIKVYSITSFIISSLTVTVLFVILLFVRLILGISILKWANKIESSHVAFQRSLEETTIVSIPSKVNEDKTNDPEAAGDAPDGESVVSDSKVHESAFNVSYIQVESPTSKVPPEIKIDDSTVISSYNSPVDILYERGNPNTESSSIDPDSRRYLYGINESVPPTLEELRNKSLLERDKVSDISQELRKVARYKMSSKRIW